MKKIFSIFAFIAISSVLFAQSTTTAYVTIKDASVPGALEGVFSISSTEKIYFSQGNLQYNAGNGFNHITMDGTEQGTWRFAEHQYDYIGNANSNVSQTYNGWIDAFSWATSGWNSGAQDYQPWQTTQSHAAHFIKGDYNNNMYDYPKSDWGYFNAISNGGNVAGKWRTLKESELSYLLNTRTNAADKKGLGKVGETYGLILLPDSWTLPTGLSFYSFAQQTSFYNNYTIAQWALMEKAGAVFMPCAGDGSAAGEMGGVNGRGNYWTSTVASENYIYRLGFENGTLGVFNSGSYRDQRFSVRLVVSTTETVPVGKNLPTVVSAEVSVPAGKFDGLASNHVFTVNGKQVYFSQGNLQYCAQPEGVATTHKTIDGEDKLGQWRFADSQLTYLGLDNNKPVNRNATSSTWIDIFAWGTSGYQENPWEFPNYSGSMISGDDRKRDWGYYNAISNAGNKPGLWRTLTPEEWTNLTSTHTNWYATIDGKTGYVILPDVYNWPAGLSQTGSYNATQWTAMADSGAVFLTTTQYLTESGGDGMEHNYWTATAPKRIHNLEVANDAANVGQGVRLVGDKDVIDEAKKGAATSLGGEVKVEDLGSDNLQLTAVPALGYAFHSWDDGTTSAQRVVVNTGTLVKYKAYFKRTDFGNGGEVAIATTSLATEDFQLSLTVGECATFVKWNNDKTDLSISYNISEGVVEPIFDMANLQAKVTASEAGTINVLGKSCAYELHPSPADGYAFYQWEDASATNPRTIAYSKATYAAEFRKTFTATFNGGAHPGGEVPAPVKDFVLASAPAMTAATNYEFVGWSTIASEGSAVITYPFFITQDTTLYAQYAYTGDATVTFNLQGHSLSDTPSPMPTTGGAAITLPTITPKDCYNFLGWARDAAATEAEFAAGSSYKPYQASVTLYAIYSDKPMLYHQAEHATGGVVTITEGDCDYTLEAVADPGYAFYKWQDLELTNPQSQVATRTVGYAEEIYTALFAKIWNVTLVDGLDQEVKAVYAECSIEEAPARTPLPGQVFCGWATTAEADQPNVVFPLFPTKDTVIYSVYRDKPGDVIVATDKTIADLDILPVQAPFTNIVIKNGAVLTASESAANALHFAKVTIEGGAKLTVPETMGIAADSLIMLGGASDASDNYQFVYPQLVANGKVNTTNNVIFYDYLLNKAQQYSLTLPVDVAIAEITYADGTAAALGTDYKVAQYDGAARAAGSSTGWNYLANTTDKLKAGVGYTIFAKPLYYQYGGSGTPVQAKFSRLRFPLHISADFTEGEKTLSVSSHAAVKPNDAGWNLLGNPYFASYEDVKGLEGNNGIHLLTLQPDGSYIWTGTQRYVVIPADNGKAYASVLASEASLPAFKNYFVQIGNGDAVVMKLDHRAQDAPYRATSIQESDEQMLGVVLTQDGGEKTSDKFGVLIGEAYTANYEINADLQKFAHNQGTNVYAWMQNSELAYVAINEQIAANAIPVGYCAPVAGTYIFELDEHYTTDGIHSIMIYDNQAKISTNLLTNSYSFTTTAGQNNARFVLTIEKGIATGVNKVDANDNNLEKVVKEGSLYIYRNGKVYNAQGACVK